ncbi:MAG: hypothetical protein ACON4R_00080 [Akkermansiaceae bacterium]
MKPVIVISVFLAALACGEPKDELPSVPKFKIEGVPLQNAIRLLNKAIAREHPGKPELLVAYVESPHRSRNDRKPLTLELVNNPITLPLGESGIEDHRLRLAPAMWGMLALECRF